MALDEALLVEAARSGRAFLRLYCWDPPCLSFGRNERPIERRGIDTVRRPTGGRAVWHEHEVTYAVAAPVATFGRLRDAYRAIHERLAAALRSLGADVVLAPHRPTVRLRPQGSPLGSDGPTSCFASPVGGEILVAGRKLVGSAQVRRGAAFLQHGSILLDGSQAIAGAVRGEITLREVLGRPAGFEEVSAAIVEAWWQPLPSAASPPVTR